MQSALGTVAFQHLPPKFGSGRVVPSVRALVESLKTWLMSPATQSAVHAPAQGMVQKVQSELTSLSEDSDTFNIPGLESASVRQAVGMMLSPPWDSQSVDVLAAMIASTELEDSWSSTSATRMNNSRLMYYKVFWAWDDIGCSRHLAACSMDSAFEGEMLEVVVNTSYDAHGSPHTSQNVVHGTLEPEDISRIVTQLEYVCNSNVVQALSGLHRQSPLLKYNKHMVRAAAAAFGPGDTAVQGMRDIIETTRSLLPAIAGAISGFLKSSSQSVSFLRRAGEFSRYHSETNSYSLQGVLTSDLEVAMRDIVTMDIPTAPEKMLQHLEILMLGTKNQSGWTGHIVHFNQTTGGDATTAMGFHTPRDDGTHDLAVCTVSATFQVLGDLEIITTNTKYLGGLISGGSSTRVIELPPAWTVNDTDALNNYMIVECLNDLSQTWTAQGPVQLPDLPPAREGILIV